MSDLAAGLFAIGGVALGGVIAEFRAWCEGGASKNRELTDLRRTIYVRSLRSLESVSAACARWLESGDPERTAEFWKIITDAYELLNEVRLITGDLDSAQLMDGMLRRYRHVIERNQTEFPQLADDRTQLVNLWRADVKMTSRRLPGLIRRR